MSNFQPWKVTVAEKRGKKENRIPPFAPSENEQQFYRKYLKLVFDNQKLLKKALILGATPELRDLTIESGIESVAVDLSPKMMEKLSGLMDHEDHNLDKRIIKNWLKMNFPESFFGIIMGDAPFINLATKEQNLRLAKICSKVLNSEGFLIMRQVVYSENNKGYKDVLKLIEDFRNKKINWAEFFGELRLNVFKDKIYNKKTFQYDAKEVYEIIEDLHSKGIINQEEQDLVNKFRNDIINTFYPRKEFIEMIESQKFKLIEEFHDKSFKFFDYIFMMAFQKQ